MTNFDNLTAEESDDLLRQEIFAEEENSLESGTNDSEEQVEVQPEEEEQSEEVDTEDTTEEESTEAEQAEEKPKKKSNVAKILSEKNEYKRNWLQAQERIKELEQNL